MNKNTFKAIVIMGISSVLGYIITLALTSYITEIVGVEAFGYVSIAKTIVNYGGIVTVALTSFIVRYVTLHYHKNEMKEAKEFYVSSINASVTMCCLLTLVFCIVVIYLERIIKIPDNLVHAVKILFCWVFSSFVATTLSTSFSVGFYIKNKLYLSGIIKILSYISEIAVLVLLFSSFSPSVWFVGVGSFAASLVVLLGSMKLNKKLIPEFKYRKKYYSKKKVHLLLKNGLWNSINQLGNTLNSGLDLLVSNSLLSGIQTGQIAISKSLGAIFNALSGILFQPLQPELLKTFSSDPKGAFLIQLKESMKLCGLFGSIAFAGFFSLGKPFYSLLVPSQDSQLLFFLTLLTIFPFVLDIFLQPIYYVYTLTIKNVVPCIVTIVGGLLNVISMYILIKYTSIGLYSVPLTTAVIMFCINFFFNPVYASCCLKESKLFFYPLTIKHLIATAVLCVLLRVISNFFNPNNWLKLVLVAVILVLFGIPLYFFIVFSKTERKKMLQNFKHFIASHICQKKHCV